MNLSAKDRREYQEWLNLKSHIREATAIPRHETGPQQRKRIQQLINDFPAFCQYYFPHYVQSPFGWFHLEAARLIQRDPNLFAVLEWPREHAKSVFANVLIPAWLKARGELDGMMIGSANGDKAKGLLGDIQAELMDNQRYVNDFGEQFRLGDWQDGHFATADGCGFWAFGRGQSPRGTRKAAKRPNYGSIDDIDDKDIVKNEQRVLDAVDWVLGDFYGAMSIKGARLVVSGNRIHCKSILAHLVGDVEVDDPVREGITHIKVYAFQQAKGKSKRARKEASPVEGVPAWHERYTVAELIAKMDKMGYRVAQREFFHKHIDIGFVFKPEMIHWVDPLPLQRYDALVTYCDPSYKETKKNDFKAIVLLGRKGVHYDVLKAWVRQSTAANMAAAHFDLHEYTQPNLCRHYMEANFIQDLLMHAYDAEGVERDYMLPLRPDKRKKPDKYGRIENLSPLFERKVIRFSSKERKDPDMKNLIGQFLGFPFGHDDGPDAVEGAIFMMNKISRAGSRTVRTGRYHRSRKRRG